MYSFVRTGIVLAVVLLTASAQAQESHPDTDSVPPSQRDVPISQQRDLVDIARKIFPFLKLKQSDSTLLPVDRTFAWVVPEAGYSLQTRLLAQLQGNIAYRRPEANVSTIIPAMAYSQNKQLFLANWINLWSRNNRYNWVGDYRLYKYPQATYGLGTSSVPADELMIDFSWLRVHQTLLRQVRRNLYAGLGYQLDVHWNIRTSREGTPVAIPNYQEGVSGRSISSGIALQALYDGRINSLNPDPAWYANLILRTNLRALGSNSTYESVLLDVRRYLYLPARSAGILALWAYGSFTIGNNPPYLDLPYSGSDTYENGGRGYVQGRFRGRNFLYQEAEHRFPISRNRLVGGVVFINNQVVAEPVTGRFGPFALGYGAGLRIRANKFSRLNIAVDYGLGRNGSQGFFFNFGEYF